MKTIRASSPSKILLLSVSLLFFAARTAHSASYIWAHPTPGNWNLAANWSPAGVPIAGDTATISPAGTYTVTVNDTEAVGTLTMSGASGVQTLNISGGTLSIGSASTGNANAIVTISSGTLNGSGGLALAGNLNWTGGTISLGLQIGGGSFSEGDLTLNGGMLTNNGTINWINGGFLLDGNGSVFTNLSGATIILSNTPNWVQGGNIPSGTHVFGNGGTIIMDGPASVTTTMTSENFTNSGTITVNSGKLFLSGGTNSDSGPVTVASGATLELSGADTFSAASSISGAGNLLVSGGTATLNSGLGLTGSWTFSAGATTVTGTDGVIFNVITVSGGTVNFDGSGNIVPDTFTVSSGTLAGSQNLFAGDLVWTGGTISAGLQIGGGNFSGGDLTLNGGRLTNNGTIYWTNGGFLLDGNNSVFTNVAVASIVVSNAPNWVQGGNIPSGTHVFGNGGTIIMDGPASVTTTMTSENFVNSGTITVNSGKLSLSGGTNSDSGPVTVASGATLELSGADTFSAASSISGAGNLLVSGGTATLNSGLGLTGSWTFSAGATTVTGTDNASFFNGTTITVSGGTVNFDGSGTLAPVALMVSSGTLAGLQSTFAGNLDWMGGTISVGIEFGGGSFSSSDLTLNGGMLTNTGTINWTNGGFLLDGNNSVFTNLSGATIILSNTPNWVQGGNIPSGTHVFGNGGTIIMDGPASVTTTMTSENFVNSGTITVNSGKLSLSGGTRNLANGTLNFGISNLTSFGSISLTGPSDLAGTLTATFNDPSFVPAAGDSWQIMTYSSLTGAFSTISLPPVGDWQTIAGSTSYSIKITQTAPAPFFIQNLPSTNYGLVGDPVVLSVQLGGTGPFTNQWYSETGGITNALHDGDRGGRISGTTTLTLTIANAQTNDDGPYQMFVTNGFAPYSDVSGVGQLVVELEPLFNGDGSLWTLNGGATIQNNVLTLTDGQQDEARSAFFNFPMYCQAFRAVFTYQSAPGTTSGRADGITFCLQNSSEGLGAVGTGGGSLAYAGITNSMAIAIDQLTAKGYEFLTNGEDPGTLGHYVQTAPAVDPSSGDPINISIVYESNAIALNMTDAVTLGIFVTNFSVGPLPITGGPAFIGFTGGTGDVDSVQTVSNFSFIPLPPISLARNGANLTLSWPTAIGGYQLQSSTNLDTINWLTLPGPYSPIGQQYQLLAAPTTNTFYRLALP